MVRKASTPRPRSRWVCWAWVGVGALMVLGFASLALRHQALSYLRSDQFRRMVEQRVEERLGWKLFFSPFSWSEASVYADRGSGERRGQEGAPEMELQGIRAAVDLSSFRRGQWEVSEVAIQQCQVRNRPEEASRGIALENSVPGGAVSAGGAWWSRWVPQEVEIQRVAIAEAMVDWWIGGGDANKRLKMANLAVDLLPAPQGDGWDVSLSGGKIWWGDRQPLALQDGRGRIRQNAVFAEALRFEWLDHAHIECSGEWHRDERKGTAEVVWRTELKDLEVNRVVEPDWRRRLDGQLHGSWVSKGTVSLSAGEGVLGAFTHKGSWRMNQGIVMALPLLDRLAEHTRTDRFRRLVLHEASAPFTYVRDPEENVDRLEFDLALRSDQLLHLSGKVAIGRPFDSSTPRPLSGDLFVGVARSVLKWLPGAEQRVFTEERSGFLYTRMRVGGTLEAPEEDLSPRLRRAALARTVEAVPETALGVGRGLLGTATDLVGDHPAGSLLETVGEGVLDRADDVVDQGLQMVPILDLGGR